MLHCEFYVLIPCFVYCECLTLLMAGEDVLEEDAAQTFVKLPGTSERRERQVRTGATKLQDGETRQKSLTGKGKKNRPLDRSRSPVQLNDILLCRYQVTENHVPDSRMGLISIFKDIEPVMNKFVLGSRQK